jgi:hypothetical protein
MRCRRTLACKLPASKREESRTASAGEIAEVANADEASGQHTDRLEWLNERFGVAPAEDRRGLFNMRYGTPNIR